VQVIQIRLELPCTHIYKQYF